ncbi:hypothetical protein AJ88_06140 [Mesorhizobium amorphae CCBAU 01583]|nr:hypothetical protein AJ88_06140 [Mesorhizobium amorphae CCBAU 01583]
MGGELSFPNPFPNEFGIVSKRGVASYRAINSLYQAILLKRYAAGMPSPSVLDIGGGLGRTAYYARKFALRTTPSSTFRRQVLPRPIFWAALLATIRSRCMAKSGQP